MSVATSSAASSAGESLSGPSKLDAIFSAMKGANDLTASDGSVQWGSLAPLALIVCASVMMYLAIKHWHRRRMSPGPLSSHRKLLAEAARLTPGVSRRQLKAVEGLARDAGLASPVVAMICPSAIARMGGHVRAEADRLALRSFAEGLVRAERKQAMRAR